MSARTAPVSGPHITVVGVPADGSLSGRARAVVEGAAVVIGGPRHLALLPDLPGQRRLPWPSPLRAGLPALLAGLDGPVVALASGDALVSGVGTTLLELGLEVTVLPAISSVALARAAMRWPAEGHAVVSVVGRDVALLRREVAPGRRILVLSADERTPRAVAELLTGLGYGDTAMTVLGDLGGPDEARVDGRAATWDAPSPRLNIVAVECVGPLLGGWAAGLPDDTFEHDGQLTKRDLRASALSRLMPVPGQLLWDVGAGAGSVGIEWMRAHPSCRAVAIEADATRAERIGRNAARLGVPTLRVVHGRAPEVLTGLPALDAAPDAVFVGGGATREGVIDACLAALRPGGRLVVHGVTLETETLLARLHAAHGGELTRIAVETAAPIGSFTGWTPARTVTQWALTSPVGR